MSSNTNCKIQTRDLTRIVQDKTIVQDINLDVMPGEVLMILGPSGSGKTSLLRLINRLDEPTRGTVFLDGQDYREIPPLELRRRVGMMMQQAFLFPGTVADNIRFGPRQRGIELPDATINRLLERVGMAGFAQRDVERLSGGEAQRVALARVLANEPEVLLLDEPTSALDQEAKEAVEDLIQDVIREEHLTCLWVTHDLHQAARMGDRVALLERGRLVRITTPQEVLHA